MRIRWLISISGTVEGRDGGVAPGDLMEVPDPNGARYIANGYAEEMRSVVEHAVAPAPEEETAAFVDDQPPPQAVDDDVVEAPPRPGRQGAVKRTPPRSK